MMNKQQLAAFFAHDVLDSLEQPKKARKPRRRKAKAGKRKGGEDK